MTLRYVHLAPDHLQEAASVMDALSATNRGIRCRPGRARRCRDFVGTRSGNRGENENCGPMGDTANPDRDRMRSREVGVLQWLQRISAWNLSRRFRV